MPAWREKSRSSLSSVPVNTISSGLGSVWRDVLVSFSMDWGGGRWGRGCQAVCFLGLLGEGWLRCLKAENLQQPKAIHICHSCVGKGLLDALWVCTPLDDRPLQRWAWSMHRLQESEFTVCRMWSRNGHGVPQSYWSVCWNKLFCFLYILLSSSCDISAMCKNASSSLRKLLRYLQTPRRLSLCSLCWFSCNNSQYQWRNCCLLMTTQLCFLCITKWWNQLIHYSFCH